MWKGAISGATWNANGLISGQPKLRAKKFGTLCSLLEPRDIVVVTETHSAEKLRAGAETRVNSLNLETFWSHGKKVTYGPARPEGMEGSSSSTLTENEGEDSITGDEKPAAPRRKHGVAIFAKKKFLEQFSRVNFNNRIIKGRICRLELTTADNRKLHIYGCYFSATNAKGDRTKEMRILQNILDPSAHNLVMGDFNFTVNDNDRYSYKEPIGWKKADKEAPTWHNLLTS